MDRDPGPTRTGSRLPGAMPTVLAGSRPRREGMRFAAGLFRECDYRTPMETYGLSVSEPFFGVIADCIHGRPSTRSMKRNAVTSLANL